MAVSSSDTVPNFPSPANGKSQCKRRNSTPGIRVVSGRIYDPQNGKTCHQCRQKTLDFSASCKNLKGAKLCTIRFCYKCLFNRYGEKAEESQALDDWKCPKCRGICNCSFCMKGRGHKPTGILVHRAKAIGFSSVSDMLLVKRPDDVMDNPSEMDAGLHKDSVIMSPTKRGKENAFANNDDVKAPQTITNSKRRRKRAVDEIRNHNGDEPIILEKTDSKKPKPDMNRERDMNSMNCVQNNVGVGSNKGGPLVQNKSFTIPDQIVKDGAEGNDFAVDGFKAKSSTLDNKDIEVKDNGEHKVERLNNFLEGYDAEAKPKKPYRPCKVKKSSVVESREHAINVPLPEGTKLTAVAGLELPPKDVADVLQFLEFCASMGEAIGIKKAQSESLVRELFKGRPSRRSQYSQYSSIVRLHVKLLSLILEDLEEESPSSSSRGKNSWLQALDKILSQSRYAPPNIPSDCFSSGGDGYDNLDFSMKLKLLNFLCDEALQTRNLRNWIDEQNLKFLEQQKEAKKKVLAAKERKKEIKQKLQDTLAKAVIEKNGASLSVSEHESIVSQINMEAADAHKKMVDAESRVCKNGQVSDVLRTQPVVWDDNGCVIWKLKSFTGGPTLLLQDLGSWDASATDEKWIAYDAEQKDAVERYIAHICVKRAKTQKAAELIKDMDNETD